MGHVGKNTCPVCRRKFKNAQAVAAHSRVHKNKGGFLGIDTFVQDKIIDPFEDKVINPVKRVVRKGKAAVRRPGKASS